jgi:uncharacterized repeat protein (TIGR01451 family)
MSVSSPTVLAGGSVTYTITAANGGVDPAYSVNVRNAFPAFPALTAGSFTASQGVHSAATGLWNLASLPNGGTATLRFTVAAPNVAGPLTNNGSSTSATADPNPANNAASATTTVLSPALVGGTKTVAGTFRAGDPITYTVVLSNSGGYAQQDNPGPEFTDTIPASILVLSASATAGTVNLAGSVLTWNGSIPAGGSVTITIRGYLDSATPAGTVVSNQGTVLFDTDGNGTNESTALTNNGPGPGASPTVFTSTAGGPIAIPSLSGLGLLALAVILASLGLLSLRT